MPGLKKIIGRDAFQVQLGQQLFDRLRTPQIRRQDREGKANLAGPIPSPRRFDSNIAQPRLNRPFQQVPTAHHATPPRFIHIKTVTFQKFRNLCFNRSRQQLLRPVAQYLRQYIRYCTGNSWIFLMLKGYLCSWCIPPSFEEG
jgi:hypothetical protein